jgi:hypothetical protein
MMPGNLVRKRKWSNAMDIVSGAPEKQAPETEIMVPAILLKMCNHEVIQMTKQIYSYF